ncbi:MAG: A/G-specific adenine glycosylase [Candidatus Woesearchaeota archaeon]
MLQQTNAEKVEAVYGAFFEEFPNVYNLYNACIEQILDIIRPLGLLKRAENLNKIAEIIVEKFNGKVPSKKSDLKDLPGVGHYISNAVLVFAFNKPCGVLDTNTIRILERLFGITSNKSRPRTDSVLRDKLNKIIGEEAYRDYNYALLDFASQICQKRSPKCNKCPVKEFCKY